MSDSFHDLIGKPKIHLRLAGGLGNQLFQISAASLLSSNFSLPVNIYTKSLQSYEVKRDLDCAKLFELSYIKNLSLREYYFHNTVLNKIRVGKWMPFIGVNDNNFHDFYPNHLNIRYSLFLDGYFMQNWTQHSLSAALSPLLKHSIQSSCSFPELKVTDRYAAIHIRGTDFLGTTNDLCDSDFYYRAIKEAINFGFTNFYILTDDKAFSRQFLEKLRLFFSDIEFFFAQGPSDIISDFWALSRASLRITGNSTFAFWAALMADPASITLSCSSFSSINPKPFKLRNEYWLI